MILANINHIETASNLLKSAFYLSKKLDKDFGVLYYLSETDDRYDITEKVTKYLDTLKLPTANISILSNCDISVAEFCEKNEVLFLFLQENTPSRKNIQKHLNECRGLRIPYLIFKDEFEENDIKSVLLPVTFLEEEIEKAQYASAFGRFCGSQITILQAKDYGSKAETTVNKMKTLFDKFSFQYSVQQAEKDSFKLYKEVIKETQLGNFDLAIISASREYGLDDVIFGPPELSVIRKSPIPVVVVNPRSDLYVLCD